MSSTADSGSLTAILWALFANAGIALAKFAAAAYTGSGAMLAEAIHSLADCGNQVLLLVGLRQAKAGASEIHPLGTGRVVYFYAMMVALLLFLLGGLFSVYEGVHRLQHPEDVDEPLVALAVLAVSLVLEAFSLRGALVAIRKTRGTRSLWRWLRETRSSALLVVASPVPSPPPPAVSPPIRACSRPRRACAWTAGRRWPAPPARRPGTPAR